MRLVHAADTDSSGSDAEAGAECRDDRSAHGDRDERAGEACFEEGVAKPREDDQLYRDDRDCRHDRGVIAANQKRSVWKTPPMNVPPPVIAPRTSGFPRPVRSPVSDSPSENAMLTPAPSAVANPVKKAVSGRCVASTTAKIGARVDND